MPIRPMKPELNSQTALGIGTALVIVIVAYCSMVSIESVHLKCNIAEDLYGTSLTVYIPEDAKDAVIMSPSNVSSPPTEKDRGPAPLYATLKLYS